jgi:hypothetical protein
MCWAWDLPLKANEKLLILAIADASDDDGFAYPGYERLLSKTGLGRATLAKQIKILSDAGLITKAAHGSFGKGKSVNTYQLNFFVDTKTLASSLEESRKKHAESHPKIEKDDVISSHPELTISSHPELTISSHPELRKVHTPNTISSHPEHEQSVEQSVKQQSVIKTKDISNSDDDLTIKQMMEFKPESVDSGLWESALKARKKRKAVQSKRALNGFINELKKCEQGGISMNSALDIYLQKSWQGIEAEWILPKTKANITPIKQSPQEKDEYKIINGLKYALVGDRYLKVAGQ